MVDTLYTQWSTAQTKFSTNRSSLEKQANLVRRDKNSQRNYGKQETKISSEIHWKFSFNSGILIVDTVFKSKTKNSYRNKVVMSVVCS